MSLKTFATLALATGLAIAGPIHAPVSKRQNNIFGDKDFGGQRFNGAVLNGFSGDGFNFADGFNNFNKQQQVIQIQEQNLQIIDNGRQQQVVQQVQQVLIVDSTKNGFNNDLNNLFRKSNFKNKFQDVTTVLIVVQQIEVRIDDGRNEFRQDVFAQSIVVANRGARQTQSVMIFDSRKLVAQDVLRDDAFNKIGGFGGVAGATGALDGAVPTKTRGVQLLGEKPTWSAVAEDPAATLGNIWQESLEDLQSGNNDEPDNKLNEDIAAQEKKALDEAKNQDAQNGQDAEQAQKDAEQAKQEAEQQQQQQQEEQAKQEAEQAQKDAEQQQQEEQAQQDAQAEQDAKAQEEAAKAQEEAAKAQA